MSTDHNHEHEDAAAFAHEEEAAQIEQAAAEQGTAGANGFYPTNKWVVARIAGVGAILTMWVTTGSWDQEESIALIGLFTEAAASYVTRNSSAPGGVPDSH